MRKFLPRSGPFPTINSVIGRTTGFRNTIAYRMASTAEPGSRLDITALPAPGQNIFHEGKEYTTIKEGLAHILIPASAKITPQTTPKGDNEAQSVFYNPIQQFNRDLSVLAIKAYGEDVVARKAKYRERSKTVREKKKKRKGGVEGQDAEGARKVRKLEDGPGEHQSPQEEAANLEDEDALSKNILDLADEDTLKVTAPSTHASSDQPLTESNGRTGNDDGATKDSDFPNSEAPTREPTRVPFTILDALSATGLRALRYSHEIPFTTSVTANDLLAEATKTIKKNVKHNRLEDKIKAITGNAMTHMYSLIGDNIKDENNRPIHSSKKYDVIDLDPYGTAAPFLDGAVQAVRDDGGLLCVTCTDAGVWASNGYPEKSYSLYGGIPLKGLHSHEGGLRLILHAIASSAARYGLSIEPLLSLSIDFYARVFVRIHKSPADVKFLAGKTMVVYNCDNGCNAWTTQMVGRNKLAENKKKDGYFWKYSFAQAPTSNEHCQHCGMKTHIGGPMWAGPIHSPAFIKRILADLPNVDKSTYQTTTRIEGMLTLALEEMFPAGQDPNSPTLTSKTGKYDPAELDPAPFHFMPGALAKVIHCATPDEASLKGALRHLGYRVTRSHTRGGSIKTDAPWDVIWEVMREWIKQKSTIKEGALRPGTAGYNIMGLNKKGEAKKEEEPKPSEDKDTNKEVREENGESAKIQIVFDEKLGKEKRNRDVPRYPANPRENWGPMNRASGKA